MPPRSKKFSQVSGPKIAQQNSLLLNQPAEIRNRIYELTFEHTIISARRLHCRSPFQYGEKPTTAPGLIMACKQTHAEALKIYYSTVNFEAKEAWFLEHLCKAIGSIREKWIRHVKLGVPPARWRPPRPFNQFQYHIDGRYITAEKLTKADLRLMATNAQWQLKQIEGRTYVLLGYATITLRLGPAHNVASGTPEGDMEAFIDYKAERNQGLETSEKEKERPWLAEWFERGSFDF